MRHRGSVAGCLLVLFAPVAPQAQTGIQDLHRRLEQIEGDEIQARNRPAGVVSLDRLSARGTNVRRVLFSGPHGEGTGPVVTLERRRSEIRLYLVPALDASVLNTTVPLEDWTETVRGDAAVFRSAVRRSSSTRKALKSCAGRRVTAASVDNFDIEVRKGTPCALDAEDRAAHAYGEALAALALKRLPNCAEPRRLGLRSADALSLCR